MRSITSKGQVGFPRILFWGLNDTSPGRDRRPSLFQWVYTHITLLNGFNTGGEVLINSLTNSVVHQFLSQMLGIFVDSEIYLSTRNGNTRVFINKTSSTETTYQQDVINRDHLSPWLIVGKIGQGMRCYKCRITSNHSVFVCETQGKVCTCTGVSVSE